MADSKLNESPEMVLLIYRNLFFPNHTIITHETRGEYSIFGETNHCKATVIGEF